MKILLIVVALLNLVWPGKAQTPNSRRGSGLTVEAIEVTGIPQSTLSKELQSRLREMEGLPFDRARAQQLAREIRQEMDGRRVSLRTIPGRAPGTLQVVFHVAKVRYTELNFGLPKALYHSKQGWSGSLEMTGRIRTSRLTAGILSIDDELLERYAGLRASYENTSLGTSRLRLLFQFESYHQQWDPATITALDTAPEVPGIYRTRHNFQPQLTLLAAPGLRLFAGTSFQRFQTQFPSARTEAANSAIAAVRFERLLETSEGSSQRFEAAYGLRTATGLLDSDYTYARHTSNLRYTLTHGSNTVLLHFIAGIMGGRAPLFERFVLGNSLTLRGWNKFDVAPLGGERMAHGTLEYGYRIFRIFYDSGALWDRGISPDPKHAAGLGLRAGPFFLTVGFPVRSGRAAPVFMTGLNFRN